MVRKSKEDALVTRHRLLDAAETVFHAQGVSRTALQDVASAAGVTRGAVYWHFKNKAELFMAMMDRAVLPLEADPPDAACLREPGLGALRWRVLHVCVLTSRCERTRRVFEIALQKMEFSGELAPVQERKMANQRAWREHHQACLDAAVRQGHLPAGTDTAMAARLLVAQVHGLLQQWLLTPDDFDLPSAGEAALELLLKGLARTDAPVLPPLSPAERAHLCQATQAQAAPDLSRCMTPSP